LVREEEGWEAKAEKEAEKEVSLQPWLFGVWSLPADSAPGSFELSPSSCAVVQQTSESFSDERAWSSFSVFAK
jgi:hypothetical protein